MNTLLAIVFVVIAIHIYNNTHPDVWTSLAIYGGFLLAFIAAWFGLMYLIRASVKIVFKLKD